jgi:hypothetical protein
MSNTKCITNIGTDKVWIDIKNVETARSPIVKNPLRCLLTMWSYSGEKEKIALFESLISGTSTAIDNDNNKLIKTNVELIALPQLSDSILHKNNFIIFALEFIFISLE